MDEVTAKESENFANTLRMEFGIEKVEAADVNMEAIDMDVSSGKSTATGSSSSSSEQSSSKYNSRDQHCSSFSLANSFVAVTTDSVHMQKVWIGSERRSLGRQ